MKQISITGVFIGSISMIAAYTILHVGLLCIGFFWMLSSHAIYAPVKMLIIAYYYIGMISTGILGGYVAERVARNENVINALLVTIIAVTLLSLHHFSYTTQDTFQAIPEITGMWVDLLLIISIPFGGYLQTVKSIAITMIKKVTLCLLIFAITGVSILFATNIYDRDKKAFENAREIDTFEGYQHFLDIYPTSSWCPNVVYYRDRAALDNAKKEKTLASIVNFLKMYPNSKWLPQGEYFLRHQFGFNSLDEVEQYVGDLSN